MSTRKSAAITRRSLLGGAAAVRHALGGARLPESTDRAPEPGHLRLRHQGLHAVAPRDGWIDRPVGEPASVRQPVDGQPDAVERCSFTPK